MRHCRTRAHLKKKKKKHQKLTNQIVWFPVFIRHKHTLYTQIYAELELGNDVNYIELYRRSGVFLFACFFLFLIKDNAVLLSLGVQGYIKVVSAHIMTPAPVEFSLQVILKNCYTSTMKRWTQWGVCFCGAAGETRPCLWELMCIVSSATSLLKHFECFRLSKS